jgi:hypothetical protein
VDVRAAASLNAYCWVQRARLLYTLVNFEHAVLVRDSKVAGSGDPGDDGLIGEIADAILAVVPVWDEVRQFVSLLGRRLRAGRLFDDVIWDRRVRHYLLEIVSLGARRYGPAVFASAACAELAVMAPSHAELPRIERLAAHLTERAERELRLLRDDADWETLNAALLPIAGLGAGDLAVIVNSVPGVFPVDAEGAATMDELLRVLEIAATPSGDVPVLIRFLATLAARKPEVHDATWAWIDECAPRLDLRPADLEPLRRAAPDATRPRRVRAALAVIDENPHSSGRYQLSSWLRWDNGRISDKHDEGVPRSMKELRDGGEGMLGNFHDVLTSPGVDVEEVEFFLPISAINLNVDMWRVGHGEYTPLVGHRFLVVSHSTDRLNDRMFHAAWADRWGSFSQSHGDGSARWLRWTDGVKPSGDLIPKLRDYDVLTAMLAKCAALCCLGLCESSVLLEMQVMVATQAGVPAVLWRRDGGDVTELRSLVNRLAASGGLSELPAKITELRQDAAGEPDDHVGHHTSLIWDNYDEREALTAGLRFPQEA